jgi:hypothetical protein
MGMERATMFFAEFAVFLSPLGTIGVVVGITLTFVLTLVVAVVLRFTFSTLGFLEGRLRMLLFHELNHLIEILWLSLA